MARIGSLFVNLALNDAQFTEGLKRAKKQTDGFGAGVTKMAATVAKGMAVVGIAAAAASAALIRPIGRATAYMDDLAKSAQKAGTSVGDLAKLRFASELAGVGSQQLQVGITRLNVALGEMQGKGTAASRTLQAMGVAAGSTTLDALKKVADQFKALPDGAEKSALAVRLFGRAGAELIPLLNSGSDGLTAMAKEAEALGLVVDTKTAKAAEQFNDNLTRLGKVQTGITTQITAGLVPAFMSLTDEMVRGLTVGSQWQSVGSSIGSALLNIAEAAMVAYEAVTTVGGALTAFGRAGAQALGGDFSGAVATIQGQEYESQARISRRRAAFARARFNTDNFTPGDTAAGGAGGGDLLAAAGGSSRTAKAAKEAETALSRFRKELKDGDIAAESFYETAKRLNDDAIKPLTTSLAMDFSGVSGGIAKAIDEMNAPFARAAEFGKQISDNLAQAIVYGQNLGTALINSIKAAAAQAISSGLFRLLTGDGTAGSPGIIGGLLSGIFGGFRADGGPIQGGKAYMVGERGPEMIVPGGSGTVIPNNRLAGGSTINVDARGATDPGAVQQAVIRGVQVAMGYTDGRLASAQRPRLPRGMGA
jgi:hypothetical protein